ncbi:MAG: 8-amino-7-oxononanoate synthase [Micavibrio sp.]|nr:MAG: 8-amino-7-oxononanoate synthase [Micavibrio sp.]
MHYFKKSLEQLKERGRYRSLTLSEGIDLTSNDYLGFRDHPKLREAALRAIESGIDLGSGGSRLLRGNHSAHEELEAFSAEFFGYERSLYFVTGFQANYALFTTLLTRHDVVLYDSLIHASVKDGIHAGHAKGVKVEHNDLNAYEDALKRFRDEAQQIFIAVESLYSMDGDFAPLQELYDLAQKYDAILIVDEAHATGVWGESGKGCAESLPRENLMTLHTCGKALGIAGGLVCASGNIIDTLINTARPFIYSTAPPPLQAVLVREAFRLVQSEEGKERRQRLHSICNNVKSQMGGAGSQIVPIILGEDSHAVFVASALQKAGFDIRAIRPPTVPEGSARLRLSLNADLDKEALDQFFVHLMPYLQDQAA